MTLRTCHVCHGTRTYTDLIAETRTGVSHPHGWDMPPVRVTYPTGRTVERVFVCPECQGTGTSDLDAIRDRTLAASLIDSDRAAGR